MSINQKAKNVVMESISVSLISGHELTIKLNEWFETNPEKFIFDIQTHTDGMRATAIIFYSKNNMIDSIEELFEEYDKLVQEDDEGEDDVNDILEE